MLESVKNFFERIRNEEEHVRRRWLFILSGTSMAVVVALWIFYINIIVGRPAGEEETAAVASAKNPGFPQIFGAGIRVVTNEARRQLGASHEITFEKSEENFQLPPEKLPPVTPTPLP